MAQGRRNDHPEQVDSEKNEDHWAAKGVDVGDHAKQENLIHIVQNVFDSLAMQVKVIGAGILKESATDTFIGNLKEKCPNLHFIVEPGPDEPACAGAQTPAGRASGAVLLNAKRSKNSSP